MCPKAARRNGVLLSQGDHRCPTPTHLSLGGLSPNRSALLVGDDFVTLLQTQTTQPKDDPMTLNSKLLGSAGAALLAAAFAVPAQAQTVPLYSGGGTLAA